jgi:hypothetical protein
MFGNRQHKIAIDHELYERLEKAGKAAGYSSVEEFVNHVLEGAATPPGADESEEEVRKRLKGLGYLE